MTTIEIVDILQKHGIKPTANRILIVELLAKMNCPVSMKEIEARLQTIDKSNIFRALVLFKQQHLVHQIDDGSDAMRYELCRSKSKAIDSDLHAHFYCEQCKHTICLHDTPIQKVELPEGYSYHNINFMIKGYCAKCNEQIRRRSTF